jgi:hypothetical protein
MCIVPFFTDAWRGSQVSVPMYFLSRDCYVCNTQDYWIILSAKQDKYLCVTHGNLKSIGPQLYGWQDRCASEAPSRLQEENEALVASLKRGGIITDNPADGKPFAELEFVGRDSALEIRNAKNRFKISLILAVRFFFACGMVDWQLRQNKLSSVLKKIEGRRRRTRSTSAADVSGSLKLLAVFNQLRPFYPRSYLCLFDSLALLEFLAAHRNLPKLVFGVVADPFQAHCWLQQGTVVLNDDLERVGRYKPILSV